MDLTRSPASGQRPLDRGWQPGAGEKPIGVPVRRVDQTKRDGDGAPGLGGRVGGDKRGADLDRGSVAARTEEEGKREGEKRGCKRGRQTAKRHIRGEFTVKSRGGKLRGFFPPGVAGRVNEPVARVQVTGIGVWWAGGEWRRFRWRAGSRAPRLRVACTADKGRAHRRITVACTGSVARPPGVTSASTATLIRNGVHRKRRERALPSSLMGVCAEQIIFRLARQRSRAIAR